MIVPENVIRAYFGSREPDKVVEFGNGHIQTTFKVDVDDASYILQEINTSIFLKPEILIDNHLKLQQHLEKQNCKYRVPNILKTTEDKYSYQDPQGGFWRLTEFMQNTYAIEKTENVHQAYEAGKAYGWFANALIDIDADSFEEPIPDFNCLSFRLRQFEEAIADDKASRRISVTADIDFFLKRKGNLLELEKLIVANKIPKRVVHNDTKINNVLFENEKAVAIIDLDTIGPGSVLYDYGDALRTMASTTEEDEEDLEKVSFDFNNFKSFSDAYLSEMGNSLCSQEKQNLHLGSILMTFIMGIRFLTDYLNGDIYYKIKKTNHNILRSRVQQKLILSTEKQLDTIIDYLKSCFS